MSIIVGHGDRVWIKVKTRPVTRLTIRRIVSDIDRIVIINHSLQAIGANQGGRRGDAQIAAVGCVGRPGREIPGFEPIGED